MGWRWGWMMVLACCHMAWSADVFVGGNANVSYRVTSDGLSSIRVKGQEIAEGAWSPFNAENWFKDSGANQVKTGKPAEQSLTIIDPQHCQTRQRSGDLLWVIDYIFHGEDVTVSARIENNHPTAPLNVVGFSGLTFDFGELPQGIMPVQHISYFQAHGLELCHPGYWSPIGGSYAKTDQFGVGVSPANTGLARTLILWDYADWNPGKRENVPQRKLLYFANIPIPPRGAATIDLKLRVSLNTDWKHLLEPYREHFQKTFGAVQYKGDNRWIATDYLNHSQKAVSPTNPYGFHGGYRRIDTAAGAKAFCDTVIPPLKQANGQGVIVWGQAGDDPRGGMYRPDFDVLPPEVEANWPTIASAFKEAGLKLGVCTRPRHMAVREDWKQDRIIDINPNDPGHRKMLLQRFENMRKKGCSIFYLDSFGDSFEDVLLMRFLREKLGPDVLTFAEHQCDAMMVYSGGYSETTWNGEGYRLWSGVDRWEVYQWLAPGSQMAARLYEVKGKPPEKPDEWYMAHHIIPLVPVNDYQRVPAIKALWPRFLDERGAWRN
jgi:hypothetical protein